MALSQKRMIFTSSGQNFFEKYNGCVAGGCRWRGCSTIGERYVSFEDVKITQKFVCGG
ncbi:MAG: hypothetical protein ACMXYA_03295 [Candidatus Woesearchaeota archaeon]